MGFITRLHEEHERHDERWGTEHDDEHTLEDWHAIFQEYVDRIIQNRYDPQDTLVKIAAICFSCNDSLERRVPYDGF